MDPDRSNEPTMCEVYEYREQMKAVVVGNSTVGKTCLLLAYTLSHFPIDVPQTNFDNYMVSLEVGGREVSVALVDSAGERQTIPQAALSRPIVHRSEKIICSNFLTLARNPQDRRCSIA